ncbi:hypothetical protein VMCG_03772 [Cytospora schulzeri]|uniref:Uncharacterized protein n=1 Tax=Cytospora schulzeri TaxID=448051 RepID=A0A423WUH7_9PEZI|nr:hypothetical protein VMCG_03772 [Valsa malicola]
MPPKAQPNPAPCGLTPRETEIAVLAWKAIEADGKINNTTLAALANIGKPESAGRMWRSIKAKIETGTAAPAGASTQATAAPVPKKAAAGGGKKRGRKEVSSDESVDNDANGSEDVKGQGGKGAKPVKKVAKRTKVAKEEDPANSEGVDDDSDVGEV